ncbi:MAG: hypothetical protein ACI4K9_00515, partial [Candidatus Fimenecus sp.]
PLRRVVEDADPYVAKLKFMCYAPKRVLDGKSAKATKSAAANAVFFLKYLLKSKTFQWYNNR